MKELLALADGYRECDRLLGPPAARLPTARARAPVLVVGDGALGVWAALREVFPAPGSSVAGCTRSPTCSAPCRSPAWRAKKALAQIWNAEDRRHALDAVRAFEATYGAKFPKAVAKITDDVEVLLAVYDFPAEHWIHLRTTNPIESTFATVRHRTKITRGFVCRTLAKAPKVKALVQDTLGELAASIDLCPEIRAQLESALVEDCPLATKDGGIIRGGYSGDLDRLRDLAAGGKEWIARYQAEQAQATGIANLKVAYNKVFGYYIEITNSQKDKTPAHYIRKQTTVNAERYITPELKEYEEQVVTADERAKELEYELFVTLRDAVQQRSPPAASDGRASWRSSTCWRAWPSWPASAATSGRRSSTSRCCRIHRRPPSGARHHRGRKGRSSPTTSLCGGDDGTVLLITGPNMAGKSTYIRQVALITLLAQMGSFVPARAATIGIADRIFARVGASDELSRGQSTFMVEMTETARILNTATPRSLVILDEIGRGTSTYDGISLAWAIVEHLHDRVGCRTLFATHYHELTDLAQTLAGVRNLNVAVKEWEDHVVFLHKIVPGAADKSYGIHVARLAGVPRSVNERAKQILAQLEEEHLDRERPAQDRRQRQKIRRGDLQLTLFAPPEHPVVDQLRQLDLERLTPLEALQRLAELQSQARAGAGPQAALTRIILRGRSSAGSRPSVPATAGSK